MSCKKWIAGPGTPVALYKGMKGKTKSLVGTLIVLSAFGLGVWGSLSLKERIKGQTTKPASHQVEPEPKAPSITIEC